MSEPLSGKTQTISPDDDSGLLHSGASGYAPRADETAQRVRRVQTKHVIVFWAGTAVALSAAAYAYHAAKYKFESKKVAGYLKNGTDFAYALGYVMEKAHQTKFGAGVPGEPPAMRVPKVPPVPKPTPPMGSDTPYIPPAPPVMPFPIRDMASRSSSSPFDIFQYGDGPDPSGIINAPV